MTDREPIGVHDSTGSTIVMHPVVCPALWLVTPRLGVVALTPEQAEESRIEQGFDVWSHACLQMEWGLSPASRKLVDALSRCTRRPE